jgi:hypothetical protein
MPSMLSKKYVSLPLTLVILCVTVGTPLILRQGSTASASDHNSVTYRTRRRGPCPSPDTPGGIDRCIERTEVGIDEF